jgi:ferredoxin
MPLVITRLCRDKVDGACVSVCPVDCIKQYTGDDKQAFPNQLYIDPEECIDCGVCAPECPWEAIYEDEEVPEVFQEDVELNAKIVGNDDFEVPETGEHDAPEPDAVETNKEKWGLEA